MAQRGTVEWREFQGDSGDIKFPYRVPILPETHEKLLYGVRRCCGKSNELQLAYEVQVCLATTAGYCGGYSGKTQDVGKRELNAMAQSVTRKVETSEEPSTAKAFVEYSKRLVRDLEGKGIITVNDQEREVVPGDAIPLKAGGSHGIRNHTDEELLIFVVECKMTREAKLESEKVPVALRGATDEVVAAANAAKQ